MILSNYSIKFRVTVFVLVCMLALVGPAIYLTLPREGAPDITIPYVFVTAPYEGVAPAEIENLITIPLEKRFKDLENLKQVTSSSAEGVAAVAIEFTPKENIDNALQKVKDKIDLAKPDLPRDLDQPMVQGLNFSTDVPILNFAVWGDSDLERLKRIGEDLQDAIEVVPGVLQVRIYGTLERELLVSLDLLRLKAYALTMFDVMKAIQAENSTVSAGNLEFKGNKLQVRIPGEFGEVSELRGIVLKLNEGKPVRLTDVAEVKDTFKDVSSRSRVNGKPCISLSVHKRAGENVEKVIGEIKKLLETTPLPPGIGTTIVNDHSEFIRLMVEDLENSVVSGFLMVLAILFLFMGFRNALLVAIAIPLSCMIGFIFLHMIGFTLNMLVLFSLVLTVGMVVDDAVVVVENIFRHHCEGERRLQAALNGASEVAWPVITSTLTTLAAFFPMIFWPGIMGQFMGYLPKTVIIVLTASLFVAMVINPAICSVLVARRKSEMSSGAPGVWRRFVDWYERLLRSALRQRGLVMGVGAAFLVLSVLAFARFGTGVELFPEGEPRLATVVVKYPEGTDIETTDATLRSIEQGLGQYEDIKFHLANAGAIVGDQMMGGGSSGTHLGSIQIEFLPFRERHGNTRELVQKIRENIGSHPGAEVKVNMEKNGPQTGAPVSIEVSGEDFDVLKDLVAGIIRDIRTVPGLVDLQDDMEDAKPEIRFRVDRERAAMLELDTATVGQFLRTAINGLEVSKFRAGEDEYDITLRVREDQRQTLDILKEIYITTGNGATVPLASLGSYSYGPGMGMIKRKDQKRMITITADNQGRTVDEILRDVKERLTRMQLPKGYTVSFTGENQDMQEASTFLMQALLTALVLIAIILVMEFNSVALPFIILFSVILSMIGVMWSLIACQMRFSVIMSGIGVVSLAGVVVKNGIVMIDYINRRKEKGMTSTDAIIASGRIRVRPVLMTAITAVVGLIPTAMGWSLEIHKFPPRIIVGTEMGSFWAPMAVAVIFGLSLATVLTLVQVPVMVSLWDSAVVRLRKRFPAREEE